MLALSAPSNPGLWRLIGSDYRAQYEHKDESSTMSMALFLPRILTNASMHAVVLTRLMVASPRPLRWISRRLLIALHSIDVERPCSIGPGLQLPHPFGIVIGAQTYLGSHVLIAHNVTVSPATRRDSDGASRGRLVVGNGVTLFTGCMVLGALHVGDDAQVGAGQLLTEDLPAGSRYVRGRIVREGTTGPEKGSGGAGSDDRAR